MNRSSSGTLLPTDKHVSTWFGKPRSGSVLRAFDASGVVCHEPHWYAFHSISLDPFQ